MDNQEYGMRRKANVRASERKKRIRKRSLMARMPQMGWNG
jgi:hypothetical protein